MGVNGEILSRRKLINGTMRFSVVCKLSCWFSVLVSLIIFSKLFCDDQKSWAQSRFPPLNKNTCLECP